MNGARQIYYMCSDNQIFITMKSLFQIIPFLFLVSCDVDSERLTTGERTMDVRVAEYKGHRYLTFGGSDMRNGVEHDPDCPCQNFPKNAPQLEL